MKGRESLAKMLNLFEADNKRHVQLDGELGIRETTENDKKRRLAFVLSEAKREAMKNSETGT